MVYGIMMFSISSAQILFNHFESREAHDTNRHTRQAIIIRRVRSNHSFEIQCSLENVKLSLAQSFGSSVSSESIAASGAATSAAASEQQHYVDAKHRRTAVDTEVTTRLFGDQTQKKMRAANGLKGSSSSDDSTETTEGVAVLPESSVFSKEKVLVWQQIDKIAYVLICETEENLLLANNILTLLISMLVERFKENSQRSKNSMTLSQYYTNCPEEIAATLRVLMPGGRLQPINLCAARFMKEKISKFLDER